MRKYIKLLFVLSTMFFAVYFNNVNAFAENNDTEKYERDYLSKVFNSENGLEGSNANCICPDSNGFLWFGSYTGLYRYDGSEFKKYLLNGRSLPVNDIVEDESGNLWIATNGDGVYSFNGSDFSECQLNDEARGSSVVNTLYLDSEGKVWVGTKAGLYVIDTTDGVDNIKTAVECTQFSDMIIRDIAGTSDDETIVVQKTGDVYLLKDKTSKKLNLSLSEEEGSPRCCSEGKDGTFYIGTTADKILKVSNTGKILEKIDGGGLSSFNEIYELHGNEYWVCSDTGIGILKNDKVSKVDLSMNDSVEGGCQDYQGNYWFISSRQGVLQIYENHFSNLSDYWGIKQTVNSIQNYGSKIYVGCDEGLYCFKGKKKLQDKLTKACEGMRIRQIYRDKDNNLWISTYQNGIKVLYTNGQIITYTMANSGLETNQIRCIWQRENKEILIGTEDGLFIRRFDGMIQKFTKDNILNTKRILDVTEDEEGTVYAATDGYGVYKIQDDAVKCVFCKKKGLLSNVAMKVVPSNRMDGVWVVTGEGICFVDRKNNIESVSGIPVANSLDFLLNGDQAIILAGNGFFEAKEKDLLKATPTYTYFDKKDGLPVDFTANAGNTIEGGTLYMCGTTGLTSIDLNEKYTQKTIRLYVNAITEDGKDINYNNNRNSGQEITLQSGEQENGVQESNFQSAQEENSEQQSNLQSNQKENSAKTDKIEDSEIGNIISSSAHRVNIDVRMINFVHQNVYVGYFLEGMDKQETKLTDLDSDISYTNLDGGTYTYHYKIYNEETGKCVSQLSLYLKKKYTFWEEPRVQALVVFLAIALLTLLFIILVALREKGVKRKYYLEFLQEKDEEVSELAYKDLVTGVYNRNYFEHEKERIDLEKMRALVSVSVNHAEYFKGKYGIFFMESVLRKGIKVLQDCTEEQIKICRVSENIFYFWFMEPVQLETYIQDIKSAFKKIGDQENIPYSFSVGAIYNNTVGKENIDELIDRCGKMRLLDEKHAEAQFIEGKMKLL